ncbi:MAG TPA: phosphopantetheine-binding protein [Bacteroidales bacterium]|nr:phosphopantetheine-binding protein [Bacteroidales bacterium]
MSQLTDELKNNIIKELKLGDEFNDIQPDTPLFNNTFVVLDSIDALRIIMMLQKTYGIKIQDLTEGRKILFSLSTIAGFIQEYKATRTNQ